MSIAKRKKDHLNICLNQSVEKNRNFFDDYEFEHVALPEVDFNDIDTSTIFLSKNISFPLLISSMTGGMKQASKINKNLALASEKKKIALALGSERVLLEKDRSLSSFQVRRFAKSIPLLGNLGAVNLNYGVTIADIRKAIDLIEADGLFLHLNPLQEVVQEEGNTNFKQILPKIQKAVAACQKPLLIKETGAGISQSVTRQLKKAGIKWIDVSGKGGCTWSYIEGERGNKKSLRRLGNIFSSWGIPTPEAISECSKVSGIKIIAGGGLRSGLDIAKAIALGAEMATIGLPFLEKSLVSSLAVENLIKQYQLELKVAMFCVGAKNIKELAQKEIFYHGQDNS